jgi:uncharacterized protein
MTITEKLLDSLKNQFLLGDEGFRGRSHWLRVLENGRRLAPLTGANLKVVELFDVFHDSQRENEGFDPGHGQRGADFAANMRGQWFEVSDHEMELIYEACALHTDGLTQADVTLQTCWDADRLDLGRVGIVPRIDRLCTLAAKEIITLQMKMPLRKMST